MNTRGSAASMADLSTTHLIHAPKCARAEQAAEKLQCGVLKNARPKGRGKKLKDLIGTTEVMP